MSFLASNNTMQNIDADFLENVSKIDVALPCETALTLKSNKDFGSKRSCIMGDAAHLIKLNVFEDTLFVRCDEKDHDKLRRIMLFLTLPSTKKVSIDNGCKQRLLSSLEGREEPEMLTLINRSDAGFSFIGMAKKALIRTYAAGYVTARNLHSQNIEVYIDEKSTATVNVQTDHKVVCEHFGLGRLYVHTTKMTKAVSDNPRLVYVKALGGKNTHESEIQI